MFFEKFHKFTNYDFRVEISWKTRTTRSLFALKDKKRSQIVSYL